MSKCSEAHENHVRVTKIIRILSVCGACRSSLLLCVPCRLLSAFAGCASLLGLVFCASSPWVLLVAGAAALPLFFPACFRPAARDHALRRADGDCRGGAPLPRPSIGTQTKNMAKAFRLQRRCPSHRQTDAKAFAKGVAKIQCKWN